MAGKRAATNRQRCLIYMIYAVVNGVANANGAKAGRSLSLRTADRDGPRAASRSVLKRARLGQLEKFRGHLFMDYPE